MYLYFLRHGEADWPGWKGPDDDRPLTKAGRKEVHEVAEFLVGLKVKVEAVLASPLPRATQTADIAAEHFKVPVDNRIGLLFIDGLLVFVGVM